MRVSATLFIIHLTCSLAFAQPAPASAPVDHSADPAMRHIPPASQREGGSMSSTTRPVTDNLIVTDHELKIGATTLKYSAMAGTIVLKDEADKPKASFFFTAYEKQGEPA